MKLTKDLVRDVCVTTANGGSPTQVAQERGIKYGALMEAIRGDSDAESRYLKALEDRREWARETILQEMRSLALSRIYNLFAEDGTIKPTSDWPADVRTAIESMEVVEFSKPCPSCGDPRHSVVKKLKLASKVKSLELCAKNLDLISPKLHVDVRTDLADLIDASYAGEAIEVTSEPVKPKKLQHPGALVGDEKERLLGKDTD